MRVFVLCVAFAVFAAGCAARPNMSLTRPEHTEQVSVLSVAAAGLFVTDAGVVRLAGVRAPLAGDCHAAASAAAATDYVGSTLQMLPAADGAAYLWDGDVLINYQLIFGGDVLAAAAAHTYADAFASAEAAAAENERGLWAESACAGDIAGNLVVSVGPLG